MKRITRREALKLVALAGGVSLLPIAFLRRGLAANVNRARLRPALQAPCIVLPECSKGSSPGSKSTQSLFQVPLPIMPVLKPVRSDSTTDYYEITQKAALVEIIPGHKTTIWGYNGQFPGPTIKGRAKRHTVITQKMNCRKKW